MAFYGKVKAIFDYSGYKIELGDDGTFRADVDTNVLESPTFEGIQKLIDKETREERPKIKKRAIFLPVIGLVKRSKYDRESQTLAHGIITGINRTDRSLIISGDFKGDLTAVVPDTPENLAMYEAYIEAVTREQEARETRGRLLLDLGYGRGRVEADRYDALVSELEKEHKAKSKPRPAKIAKADL